MSGPDSFSSLLVSETWRGRDVDFRPEGAAQGNHFLAAPFPDNNNARARARTHTHTHTLTATHTVHQPAPRLCSSHAAPPPPPPPARIPLSPEPVLSPRTCAAQNVDCQGYAFERGSAQGKSAHCYVFGAALKQGDSRYQTWRFSAGAGGRGVTSSVMT